MESIWTKTSHRISFQTMQKDCKTDILIIGGGMAGILCAYMLQKNGADYVLVEADKICNGITRDTTAKITYQNGLIYDKLLRKYGEEKAAAYLNAHKKALEDYNDICKNIDCDFTRCDSYVYSVNDREKIENEVFALNKLGIYATFNEEVSLPFSIAGAVKVKNQAQFHPLKFAFSVAQKLNIFENTKVLELRDDGVTTNRGTIRAKKIIVATHFPFCNKHGGYFLKMYQHRSYVLALENATQVNGIYVDENEKGLSFRNYNNLLLLGGGGHRTGKNGGNWKELEEFARKNYPNSNVICRWSTQDCITLDKVPYIGVYSKNTPDLYVATGFNKWGMCSSMVAARILTDMVLEKDNEYIEVFSPNRSIMHTQLAVNAFESVVGLLTPTAPRCPHLGCALKYNKAEHSWDCPCHGSRFTEDGKLINNPATDDKK